MSMCTCTWPYLYIALFHHLFIYFLDVSFLLFLPPMLPFIYLSIFIVAHILFFSFAFSCVCVFLFWLFITFFGFNWASFLTKVHE